MRSKTLFVSNLLASIYAGYLVWVFGGTILELGGMEYIEYCRQTFSALFTLVGLGLESLYLVYVIVILLVAHIVMFVLGTIFGWVGFLRKKSGWAKGSAILYLVGTLCFPVYIFYGLPLTIIGFVGSSKQKKIKSEEI